MDKVNRSIYLKKPTFEELKYSQTLYACKETMAFNNKWGGTVDFPREKWDAFYNAYLVEDAKNVYYHVYNLDSVFVGEVSSRLLEDGIYSLNIKIKHEYRGNNHALDALEMFLDIMFEEQNAEAIKDDIAADNIGAFRLLSKIGFVVEKRTDEIVYMSLTKDMYL